MRVRGSSKFVLVAMAAVACRGAAGPSFAGAALLAPSSEAEAAHDELLRSDLSRADSVAQLGFAAGASSLLASDVIYLRAGLPLLRGRTAARVVVAAESLAARTAVKWQPVRAEVSNDRMAGYSYGYTIYSAPQSGLPSIRIDRYIAYWRKEQGGWRIAAYAETYGSPPPALALPPDAANAVMADAPMSIKKAAVDALRTADIDFSRAASKLGTGEAFGRYASEDAQMFSAPGEFITGPSAITDSFGPASRTSSLVWHPVEGELTKSGDIGFTVGNAVFTGQREDGANLVQYSKYLTIWKRQRDGSWRFVVDGGSARPGSGAWSLAVRQARGVAAVVDGWMSGGDRSVCRGAPLLGEAGWNERGPSPVHGGEWLGERDHSR